MSAFRSAVITCVVCGRPIRINAEIPDPYVQDPRGLRHAINCLAPARRKGASV